jgi:phage shock protein PspC (stress-responsive transcriptional regulator)
MSYQPDHLHLGDDRIVAGVCSGIAEYLEADPTIVRLVFALAGLFTSGVVCIIYLILAVCMPDKPKTDDGGDLFS